MSDASTAATAGGEDSSDAVSDGDPESDFDGVEPPSAPTFSLHRALESPVSVVRLAEFDEPCLPVRRDPPRRRRTTAAEAVQSPASHTELIPTAAWPEARRAPVRARAPPLSVRPARTQREARGYIGARAAAAGRTA